MRLVGTLFVLFACAAIQLPWFTCHSACQDACLPVWDLGMHHCHDEDHDEDAADRGTHHCVAHHCLAHCAGDTSLNAAVVDAAEGDHDHGPGDHELQTQISRRPVPPATVSPDNVLLAVALEPPAQALATLPAARDAAIGDHLLDTGPLRRLATVRLLI